AALAVLSLIQKNELRVQLLTFIGHANAASIMPHIEVLMQKLPMSMDEIYEHRRRVKEEGYNGENRPIFKANEARQLVVLDLLDSESALDESETRLYWTIHKMGGLRGRDEFGRKVMNFFADRLKVQQREAGVRHDLIDAVFALGGEDDLVRLLARVKALQAFIETDNGANLLAGYKRAANILKKENYPVTPAQAGVSGDGAQTPEMPASAGMTDFELSYSPEPAEKALIDALADAAPKAASAIEAEDFEAAMAALASLRAPIDAFFEEVTVNDDDPAKREARLALLARFRTSVHQVADFSRIEG
ncbi:MAG: DALR anticodon-binding domain-containing protein, partial [Pseudomonadota bacterium]